MFGLSSRRRWPLTCILIFLVVVFFSKYFTQPEETITVEYKGSRNETSGLPDEHIEKKVPLQDDDDASPIDEKIQNWKVAYRTYRKLKSENPNFPTVGINDSRVPTDFEKMETNSKQLLDTIRQIWLRNPSTAPYNFIDPSAQELRSQFNKNYIIDDILGRMNSGFFIEAGAADGEVLSNTLFFEVERNWTGLLVEPDPVAYTMLKDKHRKAFIMNACLASDISKMTFHAWWLKGGGESLGYLERKNFPTTVYCFPLLPVLRAIGQTTVDYFSLDVEGAEPFVLRGIDFDEIDITLLRIEFNICGIDALKEILEPKGYELRQRIGVDAVFVKKGSSSSN